MSPSIFNFVLHVLIGRIQKGQETIGASFGMDCIRAKEQLMTTTVRLLLRIIDAPVLHRNCAGVGSKRAFNPRLLPPPSFYPADCLVLHQLQFYILSKDSLYAAGAHFAHMD